MDLANPTLHNSDHDGFELISESNLEDLLSSLRAVTAGPSINPANTAHNGSRSNEIMDAAEVFELIQKEHKLLKDELVSQSITIRERLIALEERDRRKEKELAALKNELDATKLALSDKENHEVELLQQLQYFRQSSEKVDVLHARLMEAEDVVKHQSAIIQQFQSDGFVSIQPPMLTDQLLAKELTQKDEMQKRLETALANTESECLKAQEENRELKDTVSELRGLVTALQSQAELDKAEWSATHDELEQQIHSLVERMSVLDPDFTSGQPQGTLTQQAERTMVPETGQPCPRCHLRVGGSSSGHHPCPGQVIDEVD